MVQPTGRGKHDVRVLYGKVFGAKAGQVVTDENGPLIVSSTPSEFRDRDQTAMRWKRAGVIKEEQIPWRNQKAKPEGESGEPRKRGTSRLLDPAVQEAKIAAIKARSASFNERTASLRSISEPTMVKLSAANDVEFARVARHWAGVRGRMELPSDSSEAALIQSFRLLRRPGSTLGEKWLPFWELVFTELNREGDPNAKYLNWLRQFKGIPETPSSPSPLPPQEEGLPVSIRKTGSRWRTTRVEAEEVREPVVGPLADKTPMLALRAVAMMARNPGARMEEVLEIGEDILRMELERS